MRRIAAVGLLVVLAAGCTGDDPPTTTGAGGEQQREIAVYLARDGEVAPVRRTVEASADELPTAALRSLGEGPSAEETDDGLASEVPSDASEVSVEGGTATVQLDGEPSRLAAAQLVHTLTALPGIQKVVVGDGPALTRKAYEEEAPQILIESPLDGDVVDTPIRLRGTANVFEATVSIEVRDAAGDVVLETFTTATSGTGTRGTFDTDLRLPGESGPLTITAFEASAEDGRPLHVVDVDVDASG
jgi:Immunoglobulin-like domain of bacterial spore germination/Sporulation and spore germination